MNDVLGIFCKASLRPACYILLSGTHHKRWCTHTYLRRGG